MVRHDMHGGDEGLSMQTSVTLGHLRTLISDSVWSENADSALLRDSVSPEPSLDISASTSAPRSSSAGEGLAALAAAASVMLA